MVRSWILAPSLVSLREEINRLAPARGKASDGSIGDEAHQATPSDHNPDGRGVVHAIDVTAALHRPGWTMARLVETIVTRHRAGRDDRLTYVIYAQRIASASWGWTWRAYGGASPHIEHAHFSCSDDPTRERDTRAWGLLAESERDGEDMPTADEVADAVMKRLNASPMTIYSGWNQPRLREYDTDPATLVQVPAPARGDDDGLMTPASAITLTVRAVDKIIAQNALLATQVRELRSQVAAIQAKQGVSSTPGK